jgi:hypothetical protein
LVTRAVERANNRINRRGHTPKPCPVEQLDAAMAGAWDGVPRAAHLIGCNADQLTRLLDTYTRALLTQGLPHQPAVLDRMVKELTRG